MSKAGRTMTRHSPGLTHRIRVGFRGGFAATILSGIDAANRRMVARGIPIALGWRRQTKAAQGQTSSHQFMVAI